MNERDEVRLRESGATSTRRIGHSALSTPRRLGILSLPGHHRATSPSGKARVCKTLTVGSIPTVASTQKREQHAPVLYWLTADR